MEEVKRNEQEDLKNLDMALQYLKHVNYEHSKNIDHTDQEFKQKFELKNNIGEILKNHNKKIIMDIEKQ